MKKTIAHIEGEYIYFWSDLWDGMMIFPGIVKYSKKEVKKKGRFNIIKDRKEFDRLCAIKKIESDKYIKKYEEIQAERAKKYREIDEYYNQLI